MSKGTERDLKKLEDDKRLIDYLELIELLQEVQMGYVSCRRAAKHIMKRQVWPYSKSLEEILG